MAMVAWRGEKEEVAAGVVGSGGHGRGAPLRTNSTATGRWVAGSRVIDLPSERQSTFTATKALGQPISI